jgi:hypothetical protein
MSVVLNALVPSSVLKKKHNAVAHHCVQEAIAAGILANLSGWISLLLIPLFKYYHSIF